MGRRCCFKRFQRFFLLWSIHPSLFQKLCQGNFPLKWLYMDNLVLCKCYVFNAEIFIWRMVTRYNIHPSAVISKISFISVQEVIRSTSLHTVFHSRHHYTGLGKIYQFHKCELLFSIRETIIEASHLFAFVLINSYQDFWILISNWDRP